MMVDQVSSMSEIEAYRSRALETVAERQQHDLMLADAISMAKSIGEIEALLGGKKRRRARTRSEIAAAMDQLSFDFDENAECAEMKSAETGGGDENPIIVGEGKQKLVEPGPGHEVADGVSLSNQDCALTPHSEFFPPQTQAFQIRASLPDLQFACTDRKHADLTGSSSRYGPLNIHLGRRWPGVAQSIAPPRENAFMRRGRMPSVRRTRCRDRGAAGLAAQMLRRQLNADADAARAPPTLLM